MTDADAELLALARAMVDLDHPVKREAAEWAAAELGVRISSKPTMGRSSRSTTGAGVPTGGFIA